MYARPDYLQKTVQFFLLLVVVALAALAARGEEIATLPVELGGSEKFVPGGERFYSGATLELRGEVSLIGEEVKLKQVCRWSDADKAAFEPLAELVLFRLSRQSPYRTLTVKELRDTLRDAGANLAVLRFAGATQCTVARTDVKFDERTALEEWVANKENATAKPALISDQPATQPAQPRGGVASATPSSTTTTTTSPPVPEEKTFKTLKDLILAETAERLGLPVSQLQFTFSPADNKVLNLSEPHFAFDVKSPRMKNLGEQTWEVTILAGDASQKASLTGVVKAWQSQLVVNKPLGYRQVIREGDLIDRRTLVDQVAEDPLVTREQVVGQMAGRDLKSGTVLTARLIEPTILVRTGELVTVVLTQGAIRAKSVARSMEQGTMGQTIRVKNEVTGNQFDVVITGPQAAKLPSSAPGDSTAAGSL
jgi:flagella basal body P-ring formation protein FlgA